MREVVWTRKPMRCPCGCLLKPCFLAAVARSRCILAFFCDAVASRKSSRSRGATAGPARTRPNRGVRSALSAGRSRYEHVPCDTRPTRRHPLSSLSPLSLSANACNQRKHSARKLFNLERSQGPRGALTRGGVPRGGRSVARPLSSFRSSWHKPLPAMARGTPSKLRLAAVGKSFWRLVWRSARPSPLGAGVGPVLETRTSAWGKGPCLDEGPCKSEECWNRTRREDLTAPGARRTRMASSRTIA